MSSQRKIVVCLLAFAAACRSSEPTPADAAPSVPPAVSAQPSPDAASGDPRAPADGPVVDAAERQRVERAVAKMRAGAEDWYGVYVMGKKVGHGRLAWRAPAPGEAGVAVGEFEMQMSVATRLSCMPGTLRERQTVQDDGRHCKYRY